MRIIRLNRVNTPDRTHLYYLIDHGVSNKELYSGLAHVTEHACLIDEGSPHFDHFRCGCTCLSHMILYYETKHDLHWMDKIKQRMHDSTLITAENVETAKAEVIAESQLLKAKTRLNEKIVRFVTEDRITEFAMGEPSEIQRICFQDVRDYWEYLNSCHSVYEIQFRNRKDVEVAFQQILQSDPLSKKGAIHNFIRNKPGDDYLILSKSKMCTLKIYFQLPPLKGRVEYAVKAFLECYLQKLFCRHLQLNVSIEEKFFSKSEKFILMTIPGVLEGKVDSLISDMRVCTAEKPDLTDMQLQFKEFIDHITQAINQEDTLDSINKYQNWLIFHKPYFSQADIGMLRSMDWDLSGVLEYVRNEGLKVVVTSSVS